MSKPYKCPICLGCGSVPDNLYKVTFGLIEHSTAANSIPIPCKPCNATGIIWHKHQEEHFASIGVSQCPICNGTGFSDILEKGDKS